MDSKLEKLKKTLILLGTIFNITSGCILLIIIALMLFSAPKVLIDISTVTTIVVFDLGLICYLSALVIRIFFLKDDKVNFEKLAFEKLLSDYKQGVLPEDVWRVVEYYEKTKSHGHLHFFAGLEICKLNETVETLIKILPLDFSNNLYSAYEVFKSLNGTTRSECATDNQCFLSYDEFFKQRTQKYENYIKYYVGIINDGKF